MPSNKVKKIFENYSKNVTAEINLKSTLSRVLNSTLQDQYILIVGSTYLISESREIILSIDGDRNLNLR